VVDGKVERPTKANVVAQHARKSDARTRHREAFMAARKAQDEESLFGLWFWRGKAGVSQCEGLRPDASFRTRARGNDRDRTAARTWTKQVYYVVASCKNKREGRLLLVKVKGPRINLLGIVQAPTLTIHSPHNTRTASKG